MGRRVCKHEREARESKRNRSAMQVMRWQGAEHIFQFSKLDMGEIMRQGRHNAYLPVLRRTARLLS